MARIEVQHLSKNYQKGAAALDNLSLQIEDGEFFVVIGPSGSGKSTVLRLLSGLESATAGEILFNQKKVTNLSPQERNVAMVFQNYALYPHKTVRGNLEFPLRMRKHSRSSIENKVQQIAELLELTELLDRKPKSLSGGQKQRVAMGRALVRDPDLLLLDEPLSNLDARLRGNVRAELARIQQELKVTTIYVTHDQVEAMTLGNRVAVLNQGQLQQVATPNDLYRRPSNSFVASFLGQPPINLINAEVSASEAGLWLKSGNCDIPLNARQQELVNSGGNQRLQIGFRPEDLRIKEQDSSEFSIKATCLSVESLGHEQIIYLNTNDLEQVNEISARVVNDLQILPNSQVTLELLIDRLYLFNSKGDCICSP